MSPAKTTASCKSRSICKTSGEIAVILAKLSSLHLATFLLPQSRKPAAKAPSRRPPPTADDAYPMEPDEAVDARADDYIRRRRAGLRRHVNDNVRNEASKCIPPPPPPKNKWTAGAGNGGYHRVH